MSKISNDKETRNVNANDRLERNISSFHKKIKASVIIMVLITFSFTVLMGSFDIVPSGKAKLAVEPNGNIKIAYTGWNFGWCNPFSTKYDFIVNVQVMNINSMHADTQDGHVNIDLSVNYKITNITALFLEYGPNYHDIIKPVIESAFRDAFSNNTMRAVAIDNRSQVQEICKNRIEEDLAKYYIDLLSLKVQNIQLPTAFSEAQIQTQIAYEELRARNITAQIQILEATTAAEVSIIQMEALANATLIRANSTAEALSIIVPQLNVTGNVSETDILTYLYIQAIIDVAQYGNVILVTDGTTPYLIAVPSNSTTPGG